MQQAKRRMTLEQAVELAISQFRARQIDESELLFRQVLQISPAQPDAMYHMAIIARMRGRFDESVDWMRRCVAASPQTPEYHRDLGGALCDTRKFEEAIACYQKSIEMAGYYPEAYTCIANCYLGQEKMAEAIEWFRKELSVHPGSSAAWSNLGVALSMTGRVSEAVDCYRRAVRLRPDQAGVHSNLLLLLQLDPRTDPTTLRQEHWLWAKLHAEPLAREIRPHPNDRTPIGSGGRRLRVGYVASDFRNHVVGWSMLPILSRHDRGRFEVFCYCDTSHPDEFTRRLEPHADVWRQTWVVDHPQLAEQIRQDRIDILVDLQLHSSLNRMLTFARKPAPVQVTYLGYAATTGLPTMDYRLTDPYMSPPGEPSDGPEELLRLPHCYWVYRPVIQTPDVQPPPVGRNGFVTFGSFNNYWKVNPGVVAAWSDLLKAVPDSRLMILVRDGEKNTHIRELFDGHAVARDRVRLLPRQKLEDYFRLFAEIDIELDPFPYNGGITSLDSLWMGVPVVTLAGSRAVGRAGLSVLSNVGLTELVARSVEEYVRIAAELAADRPRLADLRGSLRERLRRSPLMDEEQFVRDLERLYLDVWERWRVSGT